MTNLFDKIRGFYKKFKDLAHVGLAQIISSGIMAIFWFTLAIILSTGEYGEISYLLSIATIASVISFLGAGPTMVVYTAKKVDVQATLYIITLISASIVAVALYLIMYNVEISIFVIGFVIFALIVNEFLGKKLYRNYSIITIAQKILLFGISLSLYYVIGIQGVILGMAISNFVFVYVIFQGFRESKISFSNLKPRLGFMTNSFISDLSRTLSFSLDKLLIGTMFGFSILGNYSLAINILTFLTLVPNIVFLYAMPQDASGIRNKKLKQIAIGVSSIFALLVFFISPILLPIVFPKFDESIEIVQIVCIAIIPRTISMMFNASFLGNEKSRVVIAGSGIYLTIQIIGIMILGDLYGFVGMGIALLLGSIGESAFLVRMGKYYNIKLW